MKKLIQLFLFSFVLFSCSDGENAKSETTKTSDQKPPNIVVIYADDLGYGDVGAYGAAANLKTPNMDKLANEGIKFTNGYATSATCSPSRYALLTGVYPWRNKNAKILPGTAPLLISTEQMTLPKMLNEKGYHTGVVGKWHLGLGTGHVNWNEKIGPGPNEVGFDYSFIMAATQDRVPTVYIEDGNVVRLDPNDPIEIDYKKNFEGQTNGVDNQDLLKMKWHHGHNNTIVNGIGRIGFMKGGESAKWIDENMADTFLVRAQHYIEKHADEPFFLYYGLQQPHVPRTPHPRFVGASGMGPRGDVIVEADWCIGELIKTLDKQGILENTLIVLTSDNGPVLNDGYYDDAVEKLGDHDPNGGLRGGKYSLYEAGTRVPFITYWKGHINAGTSDALVCQVDLLSSMAALVGSETKVPDSQNLLEVFTGKSQKGRENLVIEATTRTAFRQGDWVMIPSYKGKAINKKINIELGNSKEILLFNLKDDLAQQNNLAKSNPEKANEMLAAFEAIRGKNYKKTEQLKLR